MYLIYSFILFTHKKSTVLHFNKIDIDFSLINNIEKEVIVRPMLGSYELRKKGEKKNVCTQNNSYYISPERQMHMHFSSSLDTWKLTWTTTEIHLRECLMSTANNDIERERENKNNKKH